ncbi:MAG: MmcQ/YjbR family DNA-binding protein [Candidatus Acidiferrales bacterium]
MPRKKSKRPTESATRKKPSRASRPIEHRTAPRCFDAVRQIAHTLEGVEDAVSYGTAALKVRGALFIRLREDDDTLVLRCPIDDRAALIDSDPDTYFLTDHYLNYPWVLARLSTINPTSLRDVVVMAHHHALDDLRRSGRGKLSTKEPQS